MAGHCFTPGHWTVWCCRGFEMRDSDSAWSCRVRQSRRSRCCDSQQPASDDSGPQQHGGPRPPHLLLPDDGGAAGPPGGLLAPDGQHPAHPRPVRLLLPHRQTHRTLVHGKEVIILITKGNDGMQSMNDAGSPTIWSPLCWFTTFSKQCSIPGCSTKFGGCGAITTTGTVSLWTTHTGLHSAHQYVLFVWYPWTTC